MPEVPESPRTRPRLSLCMIVRNEEDVLARCLESAAGVVDETIVVDTGSTDATGALALAHGARVVWWPWQDDFSAARNVSLREATGDWILVLDADESLAPESGARIREAIERSADVAAFQLPVVNDYGDGQRLACLITRLFRRLPGVSFENRIHEQVLPSILPHALRLGLRVADLDAPILHDGYRAERVVSREKNLRNRRLFEMQLLDRPDDVYTWFKYADFLRRIADPESARGSFRVAYQLLRRKSLDDARRLPYAGEIAARRALDHLSAGRASRAYVVARRASLRYLPTAHLWLALGAAASRLDRHEEAAVAFGKCLEIAGQVTVIPAQPEVEGEARRRLAASLDALGRKREAEDVLRRSLELQPRDGIAAEALASMQAARGDLGAAFRTLTELLRHEPGRTSTWLFGGRLLVRSGVPSLVQRGESWARRALDAPDKGALEIDAARVVGEARFRLGDFAGARAEWRRHPSDPGCAAGILLAASALGEAKPGPLPAAEAAALRFWLEAAPADRRADLAAAWSEVAPGA
jgi:glycosyltransferase involved in cell wall biosynthesis